MLLNAIRPAQSNHYFLKLLLTAWVLLGTAPLATAQLRAGVGKTDITPALDTPLEGYYYERLATNVHDPLFAKALVLEDGNNTLVIVITDLVDVAPSGFKQARARIAKDFDIPTGNIIISATHTHTGPVITPEYEALVATKVYDAVKIAQQSLQPAVLKSGAGDEAHVSFHRRFMMKDSTVQFNPGALNPDIVRPMGPIDPEVGILYVQTPSGTPLAVLVNFAIHLDTVGGTEVSADFPAFISEVLKKQLGDDTMVMFGLGTCGNLNHFNVKSPETLKGFGRAERIGHALAASVIRELPALETSEVSALQSASETLALKIPAYTKQQVAEAKINAKKESDHESSTPEIREAMKILRIDTMDGEPLEAEVLAFGLGDVGIVALPGEIFVELGLEIKEKSPFKRTLILTLSNNSVGYVPNEAAFPHGAYEVEVSQVAPGEGERLVTSSIKLLNEIKEAPNATTTNE
ncbi:MAG: neutral/alkaline non-lysosomal ceramidase N-terminal domain-containing protein [Tunicatimonas sp.]